MSGALPLCIWTKGPGVFGPKVRVHQELKFHVYSDQRSGCLVHPSQRLVIANFCDRYRDRYSVQLRIARRELRSFRILVTDRRAL